MISDSSWLARYIDFQTRLRSIFMFEILWHDASFGLLNYLHTEKPLLSSFLCQNPASDISWTSCSGCSGSRRRARRRRWTRWRGAIATWPWWWLRLTFHHRFNRPLISILTRWWLSRRLHCSASFPACVPRRNDVSSHPCLPWGIALMPCLYPRAGRIACWRRCRRCLWLRVIYSFHISVSSSNRVTQIRHRTK